ncbi:hypothetical protein MA16_Dca003064 [Dendrobium catenatum]|uniref:Uncharacterized protein n=1 Tax=Dendrobium catenatum TaxID=906689 RepID=A0A2I0XBP6_9ASPA|nr:hypothetical protein MA16_Dca003064 [Dendrobium catenatum]
MSGDHQQQSRLFDEMCALFLTFLRSPHLFLSSSLPPSMRLSAGAVAYRRPCWSQISPTGFALLLAGASFALLLCGSVTFVLGCILFPWVMGFVMVLFFVGIISSLSDIGKAILCPAVPEPSQASPKEVSCKRVYHFVMRFYKEILTLRSAQICLKFVLF